MRVFDGGFRPANKLYILNFKLAVMQVKEKKNMVFENSEARSISKLTKLCRTT